MINPTPLHVVPSTSSTKFWQRLFEDSSLHNCDDLEKLVIGCEIIAAVDDLELLAA